MIRNGVGSKVYEEYYSEAGAESDSSSSESGDEEQEEEDDEPVVVERRPVRASTPVRPPPAPRRLRFREETLEPVSQIRVVQGPPIEVTELNHHLEALHLGTPGQRRPVTPAKFGLHGGRKLASTLEKLVPTDKEETEQQQFEERWTTVGALSACQEMAEKSVEGLLKHIFKGVQRNVLAGAREFLLYGSETYPEELEWTLLRYARKTELIQADREKTNNGKQHKPKDSQPRRLSCEKKPHNRYETGSRLSAQSERRVEQRPKRIEERVSKDTPRLPMGGGKKYRDQSRPRINRGENDKGRRSYISPEKWNKLSPEERARIVAERERRRPEAKVGRVKAERVITTAEVEVPKPKNNQKKKDRENLEE
ncbi:hypothetical protein M9458_052353 [Cirrhinus mrigala]|uniref:Uncharacterized protein n=1 Tax=Cirrhinus mrigala TaxID=683832 RepID=A0ABD0MRF5_CIRMR